MKEANKNTGKQTSSPMAIMASLDEPQLVQDMIEDLADRRYRTANCSEQIQPGWETIESSSIEAFVSGTLFLSTENESIKMPFITSFMFNCTKGSGGLYNLTWCISLS